MKNNAYSRLGAGITALALTCTLGLNGCSYDRFTFNSGKDGSFVVADNSYIDNGGLNSIYVIEIQNNISKEKEIYITRKIVEYNRPARQDYLSYTNIFNNIEIYNTKNEESKHNLEILEETPLFDYILAYDMVKSRYYYEDMLEIYNKIKEEYKLVNNNLMSRKLIINSHRA